MKTNKLILWISVVIPILSIFLLDPVKTNNSGINEYSMGFPFKFMWYRNFSEFVLFMAN